MLHHSVPLTLNQQCLTFLLFFALACAHQLLDSCSQEPHLWAHLSSQISSLPGSHRCRKRMLISDPIGARSSISNKEKHAPHCGARPPRRRCMTSTGAEGAAAAAAGHQQRLSSSASTNVTSSLISCAPMSDLSRLFRMTGCFGGGAAV